MSTLLCSMSSLLCTCRCFCLAALPAGAGLMCWAAVLRTQPLYLLTTYVALHAGAGQVRCIVWLLCVQLLLTDELPRLQDLLIQEKEKLYVELKNILARQPGPEVAEQLSLYQVSALQKGISCAGVVLTDQVQLGCRKCLNVWVRLGRGLPVCNMHALSRSSHVVRGCWISPSLSEEAAASQGDMHYRQKPCSVFAVSSVYAERAPYVR